MFDTLPSLANDADHLLPDNKITEYVQFFPKHMKNNKHSPVFYKNPESHIFVTSSSVSSKVQPTEHEQYDRSNDYESTKLLCLTCNYLSETNIVKQLIT